MKWFNDNMPWATLLTGVLVVIAAGVGGAVVIWGNPGALSFESYLDLLKNFAIAVGILGVGRGIVAHGKASAQASMLKDEDLLSTLPPEEWRPPATNGAVDEFAATTIGGDGAGSASQFGPPAEQSGPLPG